MVKLRVAISEQRDASYDIVIGRGLLADLPAFVKAACPAGRYVVITDSHVAKLYGKQVMARFHDAKLQVESFEFPAGERNKTRETWALLSDRMRSEEHTSELQSPCNLVCRLLLEKKKKKKKNTYTIAKDNRWTSDTISDTQS